MNKKRAEEILHAPERINVFHYGKSVWIEGVNDTTANVTIMGTCETMDVPFHQLEEMNTTE